MAQKRVLPKICIALGLPTLERLLENAQREAEAGETFLEFRLDYLPDPEKGAQAISGFLKEFPECMVLATCRRHHNHGRFNGGTGDQLRILEIAVENGACAVDVEIETAELVASKLSMFSGRAQLIVSYHNFENTPQIDQVIRRMTRVPADIYKLVTTARKPSDAARVLAAAKSSSRVRMVVLAMGELGFPTRVLSTSWGGIFTYAAPMHAQATAAGQVSARQLRHLYRIEKFTKAAKVYGVVADPVRHSLSPVIHNRAFQSRRLDAVYLPFLVSPPQLRDFFVAAEKTSIAGFSVTIPHKQRVVRYLDIVDPLARRVGAVNTVWKKAGKWRGTNTDAAGVVTPLAKHLRLANATVLVAGNGGAARGAASALIEAGAKVSIVGRNPDRVRALGRMCGGEPLLRDQLESRKFDVLVHATPLGMWPNVNDCFFRDAIPADIVFDMVYNPLETLLIQHAREQGKTVVHGLEMFIEQAARQFEIWTGESAPRAIMEKAAIEALEAKATEAKATEAKATEAKATEAKAPESKATDTK